MKHLTHDPISHQTMSAAWKFILVILFAPSLRVVFFSRAVSIASGANASTSAHSNTYSTSGLNLSEIHWATRQLVEHDAFMRIRYADHDRLPGFFCRYVLYVAHVRIITRVELEGDDALVTERFTEIEGNVLLIADHVTHSATRDLTWGTLGEAISILRDFIRRRPFLMEVDIFEGLDGRGIPIGQISIRLFPFHSTQGGNVETT